MNKRVIYSYFSDNESRFVVDYLYNKHGWEPVFFHGRESMRKWVDKSYPNAILHDSNAMRKSRFDYSQLVNPIPVDAVILASLSEYESTYLNWLEDTTGWNFSIWERRRYYHDILKFWNTVIRKLKPDILIAYTWPHLPSDYPLYLLCKHFYNIPVLFFNPTPLLDDDNYTICCSLEDLSKPFIDTYVNEKELTASPPVKLYLEKLRSANAQIPRHLKKYYTILDESYRDRYFDYLRMIKWLLTGRAFKEGGGMFKKNRQPWDSKKSKQTNIGYILFRMKLAKSNKQLKKYYNQYVTEPDFKANYIYFAAPYQPEAIGNVIAGTYEDIFLILDMIADVLPKGWYIFYKEHPNTLKPNDKGALERSKYFYDKVASYKRLKFISHKINTFCLIDNSRAVCTVGGTVGWESVVRGKPALVFGSLWYQACNSVFKIRSHQDMRDALKRIINGYLPSKDDVDRYAEAVYQNSYNGLISLNYFNNAIKACENPKFEMERIAEAFHSAYETFYGR